MNRTLARASGNTLLPLLWTLLAGVILLLFWEAYSPVWRGHLEVDVGAFYARASYFFSNGTWKGMPYNEYQPGALWLFVFLYWLTPSMGSYDAFLMALMAANAFLMVAHFSFFVRYGHRFAAAIFVAILAATGPILFFRFELFVSLLTLWAWHTFQRRSTIHAGFLLGIASSMKLYPVVLMPFLVLEHVRRGEHSPAVHTIFAFFAGALTPVFLLISFGSNWADVLQSVRVHELKPIGLEGIWGNLITLLQSANGIPLRITPGYGVHGLSSDLAFLGERTISVCWVVLSCGLIAGILWKRRRRGFTDAGLAYLTLFAFLFFTKVVNPQYLWWFVVFLPFVPLGWYTIWTRWLIIGGILLSLILTQIVYPLFYSDFLDWFNGNGGTPLLFSLVVLRNAILLTVLILSVARLWSGRSTSGTAHS